MTTLVFAGCFLALAALSGLVAATGSRWAWRLPLIAATPVLALAVWWQLSQRDGLPTSSHPTDVSAFVAGVVKAPTPEDAGAVYLWAQPPNSDTPRAYRLPYSSGLEQQVAQAAKAAKAGQRSACARRARRGAPLGRDPGRRRREVEKGLEPAPHERGAPEPGAWWPAAGAGRRS